MTVNFKSVLNGDSNAFTQVPVNILKYLLGTKSLYQPTSAFYDFAFFWKYTSKESWSSKLRNNIDVSSTLKVDQDNSVLKFQNGSLKMLNLRRTNILLQRWRLFGCICW